MDDEIELLWVFWSPANVLSTCFRSIRQILCTSSSLDETSTPRFASILLGTASLMIYMNAPDYDTLLSISKHIHVQQSLTLYPVAKLGNTLSNNIPICLGPHLSSLSSDQRRSFAFCCLNEKVSLRRSSSAVFQSLPYSHHANRCTSCRDDIW